MNKENTAKAKAKAKELERIHEREVENLYLSQLPADRQVMLGDLAYKIGAHGYVYVWLNNDWVRSTKTESVLLKAMGVEEERRERAMRQTMARRKFHRGY